MIEFSFTGLPPREARRLRRQLRLYAYDYPHLRTEELAELWQEEQLHSLDGSWLQDYLEGEAWQREIPRALSLLRRMLQQRERDRVTRRQARDQQLDRMPATEQQLRRLQKISQRSPEFLAAVPEEVSRLKAARLLVQAAELRGKS